MVAALWILALVAPTAPGAMAEAADLSQAGTPANNPGSWVTNDDYPAEAMRAEHEGVTAFRLTYDATGKTTGCEVTSSSGHAELDEATCRLLAERATFIPGRDAAGKQTGGTYSNRVRWQIPDGDYAEMRTAFMPENIFGNWPRGAFPKAEMAALDPANFYPEAARKAGEEGIVHMRLSIDVEGRVTGCEVTDSSLSETLDTAACALMRDQGAFEPALDSEGKPAPATFAAHFDWALPVEESVEDKELAKTLAAAPARVKPFPMSEPGSAHLSIVINADGRVGDCSFEGSGQMAGTPEMSPCVLFGGEDQRYQPFADKDGKPVARRVTVETDVRIEDAATDTD